MNVPLVQGTGLTKRKLRKPGVKGSKFSTTKGDNRGRPAKIVSYCPDCVYDIMANNAQIASKADPEKHPHVPARDARVGKCKFNHTWPIGGQSRTSNLVKPYPEVVYG